MDKDRGNIKTLNASPWSDIIAKYIYGNVSHRMRWMNLEPKMTNLSSNGSKNKKHSNSSKKTGSNKHQCCHKKSKKAAGKSAHQHCRPAKSSCGVFDNNSCQNELLCQQQQPVTEQRSTNIGASWPNNSTNNRPNSELETDFFEAQSKKATNSTEEKQSWMNLEPKLTYPSSTSSSTSSLKGSKKRKHSSLTKKNGLDKHQCCCKRYKKANGKSVHQHYKPAKGSGGKFDNSGCQNKLKCQQQQPVPEQCATNIGADWSNNSATNCSNSEFDAGFFEDSTQSKKATNSTEEKQKAESKVDLLWSKRDWDFLLKQSSASNKMMMMTNE